MRLLPICLAALLLTSCATAPAPRAPSTQESAARQLLQEGKYADAAKAYAMLAANAKSPLRDQLRLQEADAWWLGKDAARAEAALLGSQRKRLGAGDQVLHDLLQAELKLVAGDANAAASLLARDTAAVPESQRRRWADARIRSFVAQRRFFDAANETAKQGVADAETRRRIEGWLSQLDNAALTQAAQGLDAQHPLASMIARLLNRRGLPVPAALAKTSRSIRFSAEVPAAEADGRRPPQRIAVLLPFSGARAGAASSLRDGLLAAYYGSSGRRPSLKFYDTQSSAAGAKAAQGKALLEGAQLIIGPLGRDELAAVLTADNTIPVLGLNKLPGDGVNNAIGFALNPEEEGEILAQRVIARGQRDVMTLSDGDEFAQRALAAFRERLLIEGGKVIVEVQTNDSGSNADDAVQRLRDNAPQAQAIMLFSKSTAARAVLSRLYPPPKPATEDKEKPSTAGAAPVVPPAPAIPLPPPLPRYATSLINSGGGASALGGVEFPELPWLVSGFSGLAGHEGLGKQLPSARGNGARLFGFGHDAYVLAAYLEHLSEDGSRRVPGATGNLGIDAFGNVRREPTWATFSGGARVRAP